METEFDKEIDTLLRKTRGAARSSPLEGHLDADTISAFAENALPQAARVRFIEHFADCDRCRSLLAQSIETDRESLATAAAPAAAAPALAVASTPWYQDLFSSRSLALGMGSVVLIFAAFLGYTLMRSGQSSVDVSQVKDPQAAQPGSRDLEQSTPSANSPTAVDLSPANRVQTPANAATANVAGKPNGAVSDNSAASSGRLNEAAKEPLAKNEKLVSGTDTRGLPTIAAPLPQATASTGDAARPAAQDLKAADEVASELKKDDSLARRKTQNAPMPKSAAQTRSGPFQNNQMNQAGGAAGEGAATRTVGGKTFSNHNGAWYDSAYHGQATVNVARRSAEFQKLDSGLRSISNSIGGTVVVVWKDKAYRIQ